MRFRHALVWIVVVAIPLLYFISGTSHLDSDELLHDRIRQELGREKQGGTRELEKDPLLRQWNIPYHEWRKRSPSRNEKSVHTFYTIDCTYHSLWQVLALEYSWEKVRQGGVISRVVSGCDKFRSKQQELATSIISRDVFGAYFTPTFLVMPNGEKYAPYNRPNSIWYWLNHTDLTEEVFVLLDPDMIYMKPLPTESVKKGHPVAQQYEYMEKYALNKFVCPKCPKPGYDQAPYSVGPPWLFHVDDLKGVMATWVELVPMLRELDKKSWIIEMVAYSVAMAFHNLPHELMWYGMVDNQRQPKIWTNEERNFTVLPSMLHYCYPFELGIHRQQPYTSESDRATMDSIIKKEKDQRAPVITYFHFSKYRVPTDWPSGTMKHDVNFIRCEAPLLQEFHTWRAIENIDKELEWFRSAVLLEITLPVINEAITQWKRKQCQPETINLHKTLRTFHPGHWVSSYEITSTQEALTVTFVKV